MKRGLSFTVLLIVFIPYVLLGQTMIIQTDSGIHSYDLSEIQSIRFLVDGQGSVPGSTNFLSWTGTDDPDYEFTLVRVDGTFGTVTEIGGSDYFPAMAYANDGTLYGISADLHIIDPTDGSTVEIGTFMYEEREILMHGAAFSPSGVLYVVENLPPNRVFTVDLTTAELTYIGTPTESLWGIEFATTGTLYGVFTDFFTLDPSNASTLTNIGSTGYELCPLTSNDLGVLFSMDIFPSTSIYLMDRNTGAATPVISTGSEGLISLVVERPVSALARERMNKAASTHGYASRPSRERLLEIEKAHKAARASYTDR